MSRMPRDQRARIERESGELSRQLGFRTERVPRSGARRYGSIRANVDIAHFGPYQAQARSRLNRTWWCIRVAAETLADSRQPIDMSCAA